MIFMDTDISVAKRLMIYMLVIMANDALSVAVLIFGKRMYSRHDGEGRLNP